MLKASSVSFRWELFKHWNLVAFKMICGLKLTDQISTDFLSIWPHFELNVRICWTKLVWVKYFVMGTETFYGDKMWLQSTDIYILIHFFYVFFFFVRFFLMLILNRHGDRITRNEGIACGYSCQNRGVIQFRRILHVCICTMVKS